MREQRSKSMRLLITPSLYEAIKKRADKDEISCNELLNRILKRTLQPNSNEAKRARAVEQEQNKLAKEQE